MCSDLPPTHRHPSTAWSLLRSLAEFERDLALVEGIADPLLAAQKHDELQAKLKLLREEIERFTAAPPAAIAAIGRARRACS